MSFHSLRRLLLTVCLLAALGCWWLSCLHHLNILLSISGFSVNCMVHASSITFMQPMDQVTPWQLDVSHTPVRKVEIHNPVGRFQAGRNVHSGHWYAGVPLWLPWFLLGACIWLFLRRQEKRTKAALENQLAREKDRERIPQPPDQQVN